MRFSNDKTPYKTHVAVYIATGGIKRHGRPGYYFHIENGGSMAGGGIFMPEPNTLTAIRKEIFYNIDTFRNIIEADDFKKYFNELWQLDMLKQPPKGFPKDFEGIDLLKYRHYVSSCEFSDITATTDGFKKYVMDIFRATYPLNKFIIDSMN